MDGNPILSTELNELKYQRNYALICYLANLILEVSARTEELLTKGEGHSLEIKAAIDFIYIATALFKTLPGGC